MFCHVTRNRCKLHHRKFRTLGFHSCHQPTAADCFPLHSQQTATLPRSTWLVAWCRKQKQPVAVKAWLRSSFRRLLLSRFSAGASASLSSLCLRHHRTTRKKGAGCASCQLTMTDCPRSKPSCPASLRRAPVEG